MKRTLSEQELTDLIRRAIKESEMDEGLFDGLSSDLKSLNLRNVKQGLKGVFRGEGYDYFSHLSTMNTLIKKLKKADEPNVKYISDLNNLKQKVMSSNLNQSKKNNIVNSINMATRYFENYQNIINQLGNIVSTKLK